MLFPIPEHKKGCVQKGLRQYGDEGMDFLRA